MDARSDIFSFGAMFYEMLTGSRAFQGDTLISTISAVLKDTPPPLDTVCRDAGPKLQEIVERCLGKNRETRYASGAELEAALALGGARPLRTGAGAAKWVAAAAVVLVLLGAGAWWGMKQRRVRWVYKQAIPEIYRLRANQQYLASYQLAIQARQLLPGDPTLEQAIDHCCPTFPFESQPPGAASITGLTSNLPPPSSFSGKHPSTCLCR